VSAINVLRDSAATARLVALESFKLS